MEDGFFDTLRSKPVRTRRLIHISATVTLTAVIGFVWWVSESAIEPPVYVNEVVTTAPAVEVEAKKPASIFGGTISNAFSAFKESVGESFSSAIDSVVIWRDETIFE